MKHKKKNEIYGNTFAVCIIHNYPGMDECNKKRKLKFKRKTEGDSLTDSGNRKQKKKKIQPQLLQATNYCCNSFSADEHAETETQISTANKKSKT